MKKLPLFGLALSLGLFAVGCEGETDTGTTATDATATPATDTTTTPAADTTAE